VCDSDKAAPPDTPYSAEQIDQIFDFLYAGLREAKRLYDAGDHAGREGAIHAVETVVKFLGLFKPVATESLHAPLVGLWDALMNLDDGVVHPMLQKVWHSGRGRGSAGRESLKGIAAFTVDRLRGCGMSLDDARESVARVLREEGVTAARGGGEVGERTVRGWCEEVAADVGRHGEAAQTFDDLQKKFAAEQSAAPEIIRRSLLDRLAHVARVTHAGKKPASPPS
jgi:hypothetical protein